MKGRNWREYEPPKKRRVPPQKRRGKRKGGLGKRLLLWVILFVLGYGGFFLYYRYSKPYVIGLDAGHGGADVGAVGVIEEVSLTEQTVENLKTLLEEDGRFRVVLSRKAGEGATIDERNHRFTRIQPDVMLSVHANSAEAASASGFECYPAIPSMENHENSMAFAQCLTEEMQAARQTLRGENGIRFGYYVTENGKTQKKLVDSSDTTPYSDDTFGVLKHLDGAAVLVEQCFVTNAADVEAFGTEEGCQKAAEAYYRAILRYLGLDAPENT